jgi:DNA repair exonuclease SbcCD nuclease subunit
VRFLHSGDWHLGLTRHYLSGEAQARYSEARLQAVRRLARLAAEERCAFVVVSGDVFDSNHVDRQVVVRALEAMSDFQVPLYLLPGNHDPLNPASVYRSASFRDHCPPHVHVLESSVPFTVPGTEIEIVAAPWDSKQPLQDLLASACAGLQATPQRRVLVGHGQVDLLPHDARSPAVIRCAAVQEVLAAGLVDYVALGDRHSLTEIGASGRIWYSGTPLVTDYDQVQLKPNQALLVDLSDAQPVVKPLPVGGWCFLRHSFDVNNAEEVKAVGEWLELLPHKRETVVKLSFVGTLSLADKAALDELLAHHADLFAALESWERQTELAVLPDERDLLELGLKGFAANAAQELSEQALSGGEPAAVAQDALGLLYRLAGSAA